MGWLSDGFAPQFELPIPPALLDRFKVELHTDPFALCGRVRFTSLHSGRSWEYMLSADDTGKMTLPDLVVADLATAL